MLKNDKRKKHGKLIKCPECKHKFDSEEMRELGNLVEEDGVTTFYCNCGCVQEVKL